MVYVKNSLGSRLSRPLIDGVSITEVLWVNRITLDVLDLLGFVKLKILTRREGKKTLIRLLLFHLLAFLFSNQWISFNDPRLRGVTVLFQKAAIWRASPGRLVIPACLKLWVCFLCVDAVSWALLLKATKPAIRAHKQSAAVWRSPKLQGLLSCL